MSKIIDLSHYINPDMPVYPGTEPPKINEICTIVKDGFKESLITFYSHTGTHLDVPAHLLIDGKNLDAFEPDTFFGSATVIDCNLVETIDYKIVYNMYNNCGSTDFILFYTGWDKYWGSADYYKGFPCLTLEAAQYISTLPVKGLGIDAISYDPAEDQLLANHKILMRKNIILVENLCSLDQLIGKKFLFSCLPLKFTDIDGSPTRAFAII